MRFMLFALNLIFATGFVTAHDVFDEAGPGFFGGRGFTLNYSHHSVRPAEAIEFSNFSSPVASTFGRVKIGDDIPLIEYRHGGLPVIFVCAHLISNYTDYMRFNWPIPKRTCGKNCNLVRLLKDVRNRRKSVSRGDRNAGEVCLQAADYIKKITGKNVHVLISRIPKGILDFNRAPRNYVTSVKRPVSKNHPDVLASFDDFHGLLDVAKKRVFDQHGGGLVVDFHTQSSRGERTFLGGGLLKNDYRGGGSKTAFLSRKSKYQYSRKIGLTAADVFTGPYALGTGLSIEGIAAFPSATNFKLDGPCFCTGGALTDVVRDGLRIGMEIPGRPSSDYVVPSGSFDAVQLEIYGTAASDRFGRRDYFSRSFGEAVFEFITKLYKNPVRRIIPAPRARGALVRAGGNCKERPIAILKNRKFRENGMFFKPLECLSFCEKNPLCRFTSLRVSAAPPSKGTAKWVRQSSCFAFSDCTIFKKTGFNVYETKRNIILT